jgi:hypothetical protein
MPDSTDTTVTEPAGLEQHIKRLIAGYKVRAPLTLIVDLKKGSGVMCLAETTAAVRHQHEHEPHERLGRRGFLTTGGALAVGAALTATTPEVAAAPSRSSRHPRHGKRIVDLTHRLRKDFPTFTGDQPSDEVVADFATDGYYAKRWTIGEHTGTHIDTPGHFAEGMRLVDELDAAELVAPVAGIDITRKARENPNATVDPDDLIRFERRHGRIPERALVCMNSGWAVKAGDPPNSWAGLRFRSSTSLGSASRQPTGCCNDAIPWASESTPSASTRQTRPPSMCTSASSEPTATASRTSTTSTESRPAARTPS